MSLSLCFLHREMESIMAATPAAVFTGTPQGGGHRQCSEWKLHTLVPGGSCPGTQVSSCILGLEGCLRLGISLTTHPKWYWACLPTSRDRTSLTLWPPVPCLSSSDFKVLPYMELKLPPSAPQSILLCPEIPEKCPVPPPALLLRAASPLG